MAEEQFANLLSSILDGAINASVTTITVADATGWPATGQFRLKVEDELMLVTARSGNDLTVTRGAESTTAASHNNGVAVNVVVTKGALDQKRIDDVGSGLFADVPSGLAGRIFLPDDEPAIFRHDGSAWIPFGPIYRLKTPPTSGWSWLNQESSTIQSTPIGELLDAQTGNNGAQLHIRIRTLSHAIPFSIITGHIPHLPNDGGTLAHILRENSTGKILEFGIYTANNSNGAPSIVNEFNSPISFGSTHENKNHIDNIRGISPVWLKQEVTATDINTYYSNDKYYWELLHTQILTNLFTTAPDEYGISVRDKGAIHLIHFEEVDDS